MSPWIVKNHASAETYARAGKDFLLGREDHANLSLSVLLALEANPAQFPQARMWTIHKRDHSPGGVHEGGVAHYTPPHPLFLSPMPPEAAEALAHALLSAPQENLPGVAGEAAAVHRFLNVWLAIPQHRDLRVKRRMNQGLFRLDRLVWNSTNQGNLRLAESRDLPLVETWELGFHHDCGMDLITAEMAKESAARAVAAKSRWLLEVNAQPVTMVGVSGFTPKGVRINCVYTPPAQRGHGYASEAVARVSQAQLDSGRAFCTLYTDLANPTANRIYERLGYVRIGDAMHVTF